MLTKIRWATWILLSCISAFQGTAFALDSVEFNKLLSSIEKRDFSPVEKFLSDNKGPLRQDPEYFVVLLNYSLSKGDESTLVVAKGNPGAGDLSLNDSKSGKTVGFIGQRGGMNTGLVVDGITRTREAMKFFKTRLDIQFGVVVAAERIKRWDLVGDQLVEILKTSKEINNHWTWGEINSMSGDPEDFMIQNVLSRTSTLFRLESEPGDEALERVSNALIEFYPEKVYGYANLGVLNMAKGNLKEAEKYLLKAHQIDPKDAIVNGNLAALKKKQK